MPPDAAPPAEVVTQKPARPELRPVGPVVRAAEAGLWARADAARDGAERYAERTRRWARAAYARARQRGIDEGRTEGAAEAARLAAEAQAGVQRLVADMEAQLPRLVLDIVENVLGAFDPGELLPFAIRKALLQLDEAAEVRIKVAPPLYQPIREALAGMAGVGTGRVRVESDAALDVGSCIIWSEFGNTEISIGAQLQALREELASAARREASA